MWKGRTTTPSERLTLVGYPAMHQLQDPTFYCSAIRAYVPQACIRGWAILRVLGAGAYGIVYDILGIRGIHGAYKVSRFQNSDDREVRMQMAFTRYGLALPVLCWAVEGPLIGIRMDKVDTTLDEYLSRPRSFRDREILMRKLFAMLLKMQRHRLTHGDMHLGNIGIIGKPETSNYQLVFLDLGRASNRGSNLRLDLSQFVRGLRMQ